MTNQTGTSGQPRPPRFVRNLMDFGFVVVPHAIPPKRLIEIGMAYDELMLPSSDPDFKAGTTTNRRFFKESRIKFEDVYQHPSLLAACGMLLGRPFKLSSLLGRTLRAGSPVQDLHFDVARDSSDGPIIGFIVMLDSFTPANGATHFVPGSQQFASFPSDRLADPGLEFGGEILACGDAGSMIIFNGAVWHGHTANTTPNARRSIQGYFVRCAETNDAAN